MPRGVRNKVVETGNAPAVSHAPDAQSTEPSVIEAAGKVVRSRDEEEAERYASEFLKNNRGSVAGFEKRLPDVPPKAGWVRRWVNDVNTNVGMRMQAGWRLVKEGAVPSMTASLNRGVNTDVGGHVSIVSTLGEGPMRVVLMEIPQKLFDLQVQASLEPVRMTTQAIREGRAGLTGTEEMKHIYKPTWADNRIETPQ